MLIGPGFTDYMGYLADRFGDFRVSAGHRMAAEYFFSEFIRPLTAQDCGELLGLDSRLAVASGAFRQKRQYQEFRREKVIDSYDFSLIGNLLEDAIMGDMSGGTELMDAFLHRLEPSLKKPEYCATVIAKRLFHEVQTQQFVDEAEDLLAEATEAESGEAEDQEDEQIAATAANWLRRILVQSLPLDWDCYDHILQRAQIQQRHSFFATEYTLSLESGEAPSVVKPTEILIAESSKHPELLFKLDPHTFERLIADIFKSFDFDVELTARTRDGGKDIVCLSRAHDMRRNDRSPSNSFVALSEQTLL